MKRARGILVAVEGIDGSGKSTLVDALLRRMRRQGRRVGRWHEPTDPDLGARAAAANRNDPRLAALLFTLDRAMHRADLEAQLARSDVIADRSFYSTLAYQGSLLAPGPRRALERMQREIAIRPDVVVLLDLAPALAMKRVGRRGTVRSPLERLSTLRRVARAYRAFAKQEHWIVLDAEQTPEELLGCLLGVEHDPVLLLGERSVGAGDAPQGREPFERRPDRSAAADSLHGEGRREVQKHHDVGSDCDFPLHPLQRSTWARRQQAALVGESRIERPVGDDVRAGELSFQIGTVHGPVEREQESREAGVVSVGGGGPRPKVGVGRLVPSADSATLTSHPAQERVHERGLATPVDTLHGDEDSAGAFHGRSASSATGRTP